MNILTDKIENIIKTKISEEIYTDFRRGILFELLMQNNKISEKEKILQTLQLFYKDISKIKNVEKAIENIIWFYKCGKEENINQENKKNNKKQIYGYEFDDELIYDAFKGQYGIDLQDIEYLHWWKFKAMFEGLKEDNQIVKIMGYRAMDISKIKDKDERKRYKEIQKLYALPDMRTKEQKEADFAKAFW